MANEEKLAGAVEKSIGNEAASNGRFSVYPNPVVNGTTRLSFANYPEGRYNVQLYDLTGRLVNQRGIQVNNKTQVLDYSLPASLTKGTYFIQVVDGSNIIKGSEKIIVQ